MLVLACLELLVYIIYHSEFYPGFSLHSSSYYQTDIQQVLEANQDLFKSKCVIAR